MAKRKRLSPLGTLPEGGISEAPVGKIPAQALRSRAPIAGVAQDAARTAALEEVTDTLARARTEGRMIQSLPLDAIQIDHITRDRLTADADEMEALKQSLRARGQQTPIDVVELEGGRYGLVSGWRRCTALQALCDETGDPQFDTVLALLRPIADAPEAYVAMIEENEIRVGLSYFERARVVAETVDQGVFDSDRTALRTLFAAASRAKRSKIGSFVGVVRSVGDALRFPQALGERAGLKLAKTLEIHGGLGQVIADDWLKHPPADVAEEQARLMVYCDRAADNGATAKVPARASKPALPDGVQITDHGNGRLTLSGTGVDAGFTAALRDWLAEKEL
ncbi:ParB N-terminal domain-containing protein [uncultured Tateyamaria sp.]|uniref:ParB/RepB/Spo0J family partition protein n=1 Tax=uncultured Tateyamaria sp. TaxID=455651 RepID=UPI002613604E|nr:ParB N-terminal domain-containing protein [uncultured Tateyamaria sp.]